MKSLKTVQFSLPLAETQDEYETLYIHVNRKDRLVPVTCCFKLSAEEIAEINKTGKIYYQQCLMAETDESGRVIVDGNGEATPANLFQPMSIYVTNPLDEQPVNSLNGQRHHIDTKIETLLALDELDLIDMFPTFQGKIKQHLQDRFDCGEVYVGSIGCFGFNPKTGCPGHNN
ncbi:hypothetical protein [Pedobacter sp. Leaf170]|uniref:hypothetical protein n=1 Tax=Pedobacter sp. Leaf170 TaxID=2876558 RepID=UPI001E4D3A75|nr:hypothetical protein [Pedobacter sp. Leaf170]